GHRSGIFVRQYASRRSLTALTPQRGASSLVESGDQNSREASKAVWLAVVTSDGPKVDSFV
ncbi:MAG: hypothetical protein E6471_29570, partial [Bradyrhizobium sp.]|nr:hypothetical protein [Bradyrhizobium sp.]